MEVHQLVCGGVVGEAAPGCDERLSDTVAAASLYLVDGGVLDENGGGDGSSTRADGDDVAGSTAGADDGDDGAAGDATNWSQVSKRSGVDVRIADDDGEMGGLPADGDDER